MLLNFSDTPLVINKENSIFLAGPTLRRTSFEKSWRKEACAILEELGYTGVVYIPEYTEGENPIDFLSQVEWERGGLMNARKILFHIPRKFPELPGLTTNIEFGMYLTKRPNEVVLCSPENAEKNEYLEWLFNKEVPGKKIYRDLKDALTDIVNEIKANPLS